MHLTLNRIEGFLNYLSGKLQEPNDQRQLLILDIVDYLVDQCTISLWTQISSKAFLSLLLSLLKTRNVQEIQEKILYLIKKWAQKFEQYKDILPNFREIHSGMLNSGVVFPNNISSTYQKYLVPPKVQIIPQQQKHNDYSKDFNQNDDQMNEGEELDYTYAENLMSILQPQKYEKKYNKLILYISTVVESISLTNEIIDNAKVGSSVDESLKDVIDPLRSGNNRLIETISSDKLRDEKLMEICLGIIEDINRTMNRYERLKLRKKPEPFLSTFTERNAQKGIYMPKKKKPSQPKKTNQNSNVSSNYNPNVNSNSNNISQPREEMLDPNVKNVNDLFDLFSKPQPVNVPSNMNAQNMNYQQPMNQNNNFNSNVNQPNVNPVNFFDMKPSQNQMPQKPKELSPFDVLNENLKMAYNNQDQQQGGMMNYGMPGQGMGMMNQQQMQGNQIGMNPMGPPMQNIPNSMGNNNNNIQLMQPMNSNPLMPSNQQQQPQMMFPNQNMNNQYMQNQNNMNQPQQYMNMDNQAMQQQQPNNQMYSMNNQNFDYGNGQNQMSETDRNKLNAIDSLF